MIKAAIFDMDGTILDSMCVWDKPGMDYFNSIGINPPEQMWENMREMSISEAADYMINSCKLSITTEEMLKIWMEELGERYRTRTKLKPGAKEYIEKLYGMGVKMCLATSSDKKIAEEMLEKHGLKAMFAFVITDEDVGATKTSPDIFLEAARRLGESPKDCVVIEDSWHAINTAAKAGFRVWGVEDSANEENFDKIRFACERMIDFINEIKN